MTTYKQKDCRCWVEYPNDAYKKSNGQWKCVDCYELVKPLVRGKSKTRCRLKDKGEQE